MTNDPTATQTSTRPAFAAGQKLAGAYTLKSALSSDSIQPVWLAQDDELDREVVLRFLPDAVRADARAMSELRAAVRRNRQIIHPRIVRVHDLIEEENLAAITTDHVAGETLAAVLAKQTKGCFEVAEIQPWIGQLCQTLQDAHKIELYHGNLSSANLIVAESGDLHIANFGISRIVLDALGSPQQQAGGAGDLAYMSPQQLDAARLGKYDDLYTLGVTIYELLTGKPPFHTGDLVAQIRRNTAPKMDERRAELKISGEAIPPAWEKTVAECLEKQTSPRPKNAQEVAVKLGVDKMTAVAKPSAAPAPSAAIATGGVEASKPAPEPAKPLNVESKTAVGKTEAAAPASAVEKAKTEAGLAKPTTSLADAASARSAAAPPVKTGMPQAVSLAAKVVSKTPAAQAATKPAIERHAETADPLDDEEAGAEQNESQGKPVRGKHFPRGSFLELSTEAPKKSKMPAAALAIAGVLVVIGVAALFLPHGPKSDVVENQTPPENTDASHPSAEPPPVKTEPAKPPATIATDTQKPAAPVDAGTPAETLAKLARAEQSAVEKARAAEAAKKAADAAGLSRDEKLRLQQQADAAAQEAQKAADEKLMAAAAAKKASEDLSASRKQREDARDKAEAEAVEAAKIASEKARIAEEAKKAALDVIQQVNEKLALQQRAESEAQQLQKVATEKQQLAAYAAKVAGEADEIHKQQLVILKKAEAEAAQMQSSLERTKAAEIARKDSEEADQLRAMREQEARRLEAQAAEAQKAAAEAMELVKQARKAADEAERLRKDRDAARKKAEAEVQGLPGAAKDSGAKSPASAGAGDVAAEPMKLVLKTETTVDPGSKPSKQPSLSVGVPEAKATLNKSMKNTLGMRFAPVGDVLFSVWLTRVQDFEAFAKAAGLKTNAWRRIDFKQGPDHPVVNVSWMDAMAFCEWLSKKEQKEGVLAANQFYRLPTDLEWSRAVGLPEETGRTPEARDMGIQDIYPWGTQWPPPPGAGNYTGEETNSDVAIRGYNDGFPNTSPVGAFSANKMGLYDMGGNVWQWCMDWWSGEQKSKTLRGGSWYNGALKLSLLSSCRINSSQDKSSDNYGFRVVVSAVDPKAAKR